MATLFEIWLGGDDEEHLDAVAEAALDEVERIEDLLSRFDSTAEIYRINHEARDRPTLIDYEMLAILLDCQRRFEQTEGYFNVCALAQAEDGSRDSRLSLHLDESTRTVQLLNPQAFLDLGGYGKGYAVDAAGRLVRQQGVSVGFIHGGTSSALALESPPDGKPWRVGIRNPFVEGDEVLTHITLINLGLSSSTKEGEGTHTHQAGCTVLTPTALDAEVLSTALLAMGKEQAIDYLQRRHAHLPEPCLVLWMEQQQEETAFHWLQGSPP